MDALEYDKMRHRLRDQADDLMATAGALDELGYPELRDKVADVAMLVDQAIEQLKYDYDKEHYETHG